MKNRIFIIGFLLTVVFIAGCSQQLPKQTTSVVAGTTTKQPSTTVVVQTTTSAMETCPDQYKRHDAMGNVYCPDKKLFGCQGLTWDQCVIRNKNID